MKGRMANYQTAMQEFPVKIIYRPGTQNTAADALSRHFPGDNGTVAKSPENINNISSATQFSISPADLIADQDLTAWTGAMRRRLAKKEPLTDKKAMRRMRRNDHYVAIDGVIYLRQEPPQPFLVVLSDAPSDLKNRLIHELHSNPELGADQDEQKTRELLGSRFRGNNMQQAVRNNVQNCDLCQRHKSPAAILRKEHLSVRE